MIPGDVFWALRDKPRPVLLVAIRARRAIVCDITSRFRDNGAELPLGPEDGMPKPCWIRADEIATIPIDRITDRWVGNIGRDRLREFHRLLLRVMGINHHLI